METRGWKIAVVFWMVVLFAVAGNAGAVYLDGNQTLEFTGKAQTRVSFRLQDSEGFTAPREFVSPRKSGTAGL